MKKIILSACTLALLAMACNEGEQKTTTPDDSDTLATTAAAETPAAPMDSATIMKNWMAYMTPGKEHEMMKSWNGKWEGETTMWEKPGAPPQRSKSMADNKMVMGGRYQLTTHTGNMMGQPFEGMSTLAYDNNKKTFISTWIDNMGTGLMKLEGPWDESTKSITLQGVCVDPSSGTGKEMAVKEVFKVLDDNTQMLEMYGQGPDGKEFKMMEIKYTRK